MQQVIAKNWQTTGAGVAMILLAIGTFVANLTDGDPATIGDIGWLMGQIAAGVGLISARDGNKSSEDVGAKRRI